jgi:sugar/nucleoside kinase (ribokinase family)
MTSSSSSPIVACLGEILIDFIAEQTGTLDKASSFRRAPGGAPANVAVGIARLGVPCGFIGKVGADTFGDFLISTLMENGVDTQALIQTPDAPTALAFVSRSESGDPNFLFYRDPCADTLLTESDLPQDWFLKLQFLHVGGVSLTRDPSRSATFQAVKLAKEHNTTVTFDPNLRLDLWSQDLSACREQMRALLAYTDIFLPSQEELLTLMATKDVEKALSRAHQMGPSIICVKQGAKGSFISERKLEGDFNRFTQPPFVVDVIDTTGAGDGFDVGLIVGLVRDFSLKEAVKQGTAIASLVITKLGAMTALPSEHELERFLGRYETK